MKIKKHKYNRNSNRISKTKKKSKNSKSKNNTNKKSNNRVKTYKNKTTKTVTGTNLKKGGYKNSCIVLENLRQHLKNLNSIFDFFKYNELSEKDKSYIQTFIPDIEIKSDFNEYTINNDKTDTVFINDRYNILSLENNEKIMKIDKTPISSGANGNIFKVSYNGKSFILKIPLLVHNVTKLRDDIFTEIIIQNELHCFLKKSPPRIEMCASIPQIEMFYKYDNKRDGKYVYTVLMETLDGNLVTFMQNAVHINDFCDMVMQICNLLIYLQEETQFMHRDLHAKNIMYQQYVVNGIKKYKWYIIDFGKATVKYCKNEHLCLHTEINSKYNGSLDLRLLFSYIYYGFTHDNIAYKTNNPTIFNIMKIYTDRLTYINKKTKSPWWHQTYYDNIHVNPHVDKVYDPIFDPRHVYNIFSEIYNGRIKDYKQIDSSLQKQSQSIKFIYR
jgi:hypothetical protein